MSVLSVELAVVSFMVGYIVVAIIGVIYSEEKESGRPVPKTLKYSLLSLFFFCVLFFSGSVASVVWGWV